MKAKQNPGIQYRARLLLCLGLCLILVAMVGCGSNDTADSGNNNAAANSTLPPTSSEETTTDSNDTTTTDDSGNEISGMEDASDTTFNTAQYEKFAQLVEGTQVVVLEDPEHDDTYQVPFGTLPPAGGKHNPFWQNCGVYSDSIAPEHAVHSLEHGAVWIAYNPDLDSAEVEALSRIARREAYVILAPYPDLPSPIALTAWGLQLTVESATDERVEGFVTAYQQGPQTPEPGAPCDGAVPDATGDTRIYSGGVPQA